MAEERQQKPSIVGKVKAKMDKAQRIFLIGNVLMTLLFAANSIIGMGSKSGLGTIQYVILALLAAYVIAFGVLLVLFKKDNKALKENMTNYKFAIKVMKSVVNLMNLAIALSVMIESFSLADGGRKIFALFVAILGIVSAVFKFIMLIFKFIRKKKKMKRKAAIKAGKDAEREARKRVTMTGKGNAVSVADEEVAADDIKK